MPAAGRKAGPLSRALVESAQQGDHAAFDALASAMYDRLYSIARRVLRDGYAAEDAVQEALIHGWQRLRSLRDPDRFDAWMYRLLINACHDQSRRGQRMETSVSEIGADRSDPADDYATVVNVDELERGFLRLPVEHRAVIVLTHYVGMTAPEVAQVLGIPLGTVYSRLHYALRAMRAALAGAAPTVPAGAVGEKNS
jgi:RNA polymerase sigma factor (sigma-70 family)